MPCFHCGHKLTEKQRQRHQGVHVCVCCFSHEQAVAYYGRDIVYWEIAKKGCARQMVEKRIQRFNRHH